MARCTLFPSASTRPSLTARARVPTASQWVAMNSEPANSHNNVKFLSMKIALQHLLSKIAPVLLLAASAAWEVRAEEIVYDFSGQGYDPQQFLQTGSNHHRVVQIDARGLRITLPPDHVNRQPVGLVLANGIRGDFEI